jgi:cyclohexa-1,5-dienecarbonyl-CoA hydratase
MTAIRLARRGAIAEITLDRPPLNILDLAALKTLNQTLASLRRANDVRVVILAGAGDRGFSAGVEVRDHGPERIDELLEAVAEQFEHLLALDSVTIAAVFGWTLGGGAELALLCDYVLAADDSQVGTPEISVGAFPPIAAAWLPLLVGYRRATEMVLLPAPFTARRAAEIGLVNAVVPPADLMPRSRALAEQLAAHSGAAQRAAKRALRAGVAPAARAAMQEALRIYRDELASSPDAAEGIAAFVEKRAPRWST